VLGFVEHWYLKAMDDGYQSHHNNGNTTSEQAQHGGKYTWSILDVCAIGSWCCWGGRLIGSLLLLPIFRVRAEMKCFG
jgi:hypothetical protein